MSDFWKKAGDLTVKSYKALNNYAKEYCEKKRKYEEKASRLSDEQLIRRFKSRSTNSLERICYKNELLARGIIKPKPKED